MTQSCTGYTKGVGNTRPPSRSRNWVFTLNNYTSNDINMICTNDYKYVFQKEIGEKGVKHLQGALFYENGRSFAAMKKDFPRMHIEICKKKDRAILYCTKLDTREYGTFPYTNMHLGHLVTDHFDLSRASWWQKEILITIKTVPDRRKIYWYWDETGNTGKTTLAKHICLQFNGIYLSGKASDMKFGIASLIGDDIPIKIAILDLTRSNENFVSYEGIEAIKNGIFFCSKYESKMIIYDQPHVIIFANWEPDKGRLSKDRWIIKDIGSRSIPQNRTDPACSGTIMMN